MKTRYQYKANTDYAVLNSQWGYEGPATASFGMALKLPKLEVNSSLFNLLTSLAFLSPQDIMSDSQFTRTHYFPLRLPVNENIVWVTAQIVRYTRDHTD